MVGSNEHQYLLQTGEECCGNYGHVASTFLSVDSRKTQLLSGFPSLQVA
jgi:hypothetical protein